MKIVYEKGDILKSKLGTLFRVDIDPIDISYIAGREIVIATCISTGLSAKLTGFDVEGNWTYLGTESELKDVLNDSNALKAKVAEMQNAKDRAEYERLKVKFETKEEKNN